MSRRSLVLAAALAGVFSAASPAAADFRVFEQNSPSQRAAATAEGEAATPPPRGPLDHHRWLDLTGFAQPGFIARFSSPESGITDTGFWLQRARFGFRTRLFDWMQARMELELTPTPLLQDAYLDFTFHPAFNVRLGQFLVPYLLAFSFNELNLGFLDRPIYTPITPDRSFIRYLSPRDIGASVWGLVGDPSPNGHDPALEYQLGAFVGRGPNVPRNDDSAFLYSARLRLHVLGVPEGASQESDLARNDHARVSVGAAVYANCDDRQNYNRGATFDAELRYEGLYASLAVVWFRNGISDALGDALGYRQGCGPGNGAVPRMQPDFVARGAHLQVQWVLPRWWESLGDPLRFFDVELMARGDVVDPNSPYTDANPVFGGGSDSPGYVPPTNYTDSDNPPTRYRVTFGLNVFPTGQQQLRVGLNYQLNYEGEDVTTSLGVLRAVANDIFWLQVTAGL